MIDYRVYAAGFEHHQMSMDRRHAEVIGAFLRRCSQPANIVEVGCCYGVSTAEVLSAADARDLHVDLIDPAPQTSVLQMVAAAPPGRVSMHVGMSHELLPSVLEPESVVILDGDHRAEYMALEADICRDVMPRAIILHDVTNRDPGCDGPGWFMHVFQRFTYRVAIDCHPRAGMRTHRGLAILCRSVGDHTIAMESISHAI